jgi:hypothetical protein
MPFNNSAYPDNEWLSLDNWSAPSPAIASGTAPPAPGPQPNPGFLNQPSVPSEPFADDWSRIPASHLTQFAWHPPIFPDSMGWYSLAAPAPREMRPLQPVGLLAGLAHLQSATTDPPLGLLGAMPNLQSAAAGAPGSWQGLLGGIAPDINDQAPPLQENLDNLPWPPPSVLSTVDGSYQAPGERLTGSNALTAASYALGSSSNTQPDLIGHQASSPPYAFLRSDQLANPYIIPVSADDKLEPHPHKDIDLGTETGLTPPTTALPALPPLIGPLLPGAFPGAAPAPPQPRALSPSQPGGQPASGSPDPRLLPPLPPGTDGPQASPNPPTPQAQPTSPQSTSSAPRQTSPGSPAPVPAPIDDGPETLENRPSGSALPPINRSESPASSSQSWRVGEQKAGSVQTPVRITYKGKEVTIRLDFPPEGDLIRDIKLYNWERSAYLKAFMQRVVTKDFQAQIQKYQAHKPIIRFEFSKQPPPWAVQAIGEVGGTYIVKPDP